MLVSITRQGAGRGTRYSQGGTRSGRFSQQCPQRRQIQLGRRQELKIQPGRPQDCKIQPWRPEGRHMAAVFYMVFVSTAMPQLRPHLPRSMNLLVFVSPAMPQLRPHLPRSTYFTWFSCPAPCHSYAHTCPRAHILHGFRVPRHATATPTPAPEHVFYVVFVSPAMPQPRPHLPRSTYFTWFSVLSTFPR